jgi:hypothetical protein
VPPEDEVKVAGRAACAAQHFVQIPYLLVLCEKGLDHGLLTQDIEDLTD